ncbi:MAG: penicillin-binding protein A, partial [Eubacterium sp.]|nr:penicillin-binding protein A [Eubacterium sp.]
ILGTVRKINGEEYNELKDDGYGIDDIIGESGIEYAMEKELRGVPGELTITIDSEGNVTEEITKKPIKGNTVMLTIDKDLQRVAQDKLKAICDKVSLYKGAGAVVVQNVNTGEILAAASYPTFDLQDYYDNYQKLANNKRNPMWNRFALGTYAPGSTFKPMMACAALEEGAINEESIFKCTGTFHYYDLTLGCQKRTAHGNENVRLALKDSCNIFFFNCADKLGITKINEYGKMFGLGEKTGVEIPEASGTFASPAVAEQIGRAWQMGDTIQAGIGQSYHLFTPLQLANYCATVANNGTKYESHFVKAIVNSSNHSVDETGITIVEDLPISDKTFSTVKEGMRLVATTQGVRFVFNKIKTPVACKTGTSQVGMGKKKDNNGFLITCAPYNNPEIAVASVVELAGSGTETAEITAALIDYYYSNNTDKTPAQQTGSLLD